MHGFEVFNVKVTIDRRGRKVTMAEQLLDDAQIRSATQHMRGARVPQEMRIDGFADAG